MPGRIAIAIILAAVCLNFNVFAETSRPITVWLIPSEEAEARATTEPSKVSGQIREFNAALEHAEGRVRVLNTLPPLDQQLIVFNEAFGVPNWAWVKNQTETIRALQRFSALHQVTINVRFITWDRAFSDLTLSRKANMTSPPPDVVQIGTTWAAYFASRGLIVSRPDSVGGLRAWERVLGRPAAVLPYINDIRLLFYWKRLPSQDLAVEPMLLNSSTWDNILTSIEKKGGPEDRIAFAGGLTLNLLMDYSMLVWAGGGEPISTSRWRSHCDLTSENALRVPRLLARAASAENARRLLVVPEASHQALTQAFVVGDYRATIEPANFVSRWKKDFDKTFPTESFWDHAAVTIPPQPFRGGSYLAVMPSPDLPETAFELAEFLATDDAYTRVLSQNAHLPSLRAGFGMDVLLDWLGGADSADAKQFTAAVQQANRQARTFSDLPNWPTDIEAIDIQEAIQRLWRRIGEGNIGELEREAAEAESIVNLKIDRVAQTRQILTRLWWVAAIIILAFAFQKWKSQRSGLLALRLTENALAQVKSALGREATALNDVRRLRGFSANALFALARYHKSLGKYEDVSDSIADAKKRSILAAGINGWRRGRNPENWKPKPIHDVIWLAVLLAFDLVNEPDVYENWENDPRYPPLTPRAYLESVGRLRKSAVSEDTEPTYFVQVIGDETVETDNPFLLQQALAALLQNAIQASDRDCGWKGPRKPIVVSVDTTRITLMNAGEPIPTEIRMLVNESRNAEEFESRLLNAVRSPGGARPGIGLTEAYTVAKQCHKGLLIAEDVAAVSILI